MTKVVTDQRMAANNNAALPAASLIICSRNRPQLLADTVASILQGDEVPAEIVIIDQSDQCQLDLTRLNTCPECTIRHLWMHSVGLARARNTGISHAQYEILTFTDDDMWASPTWFGSLVRALQKAGPGSVISGQVRPAAAEAPGGFAPSLKIDTEPVVYEGRVGQDVLWTGNMALYRGVIERVGFFDERLGPGARYPSAEDNDLGFRLLEAGYRIIYAPEAVLYHRAWRSDRDYLRLRWYYGRGQGAFYAKHMSLSDHYMSRRLVQNLRGHSLQFIGRIRRQRRLAYGDAAYTLGLLSGTVEWLLMQVIRKERDQRA